MTKGFSWDLFVHNVLRADRCLFGSRAPCTHIWYRNALLRAEIVQSCHFAGRTKMSRAGNGERDLGYELYCIVQLQVEGSVQGSYEMPVTGYYWKRSNDKLRLPSSNFWNDMHFWAPAALIATSKKARTLNGTCLTARSEVGSEQFSTSKGCQDVRCSSL